MKAILFILRSINNVLFSSADPNLFGSKKRQAAASALASEMKGYAEDAQAEIDELKSLNPFESASAKSAMATASRNSKQLAQKYANVMGGGASPEAIVAAQGATQQAVSGAAGAIASGAEANKASQISSLKNEKASYLGQYSAAKQDQMSQIGSGWTSFFNEALPAASSLMSGSGEAASAIGGEGGSSAIMAALSDRRMKENIEYIGELQGQRIYKFNYIGDSVVIIGVMAQDIEKDHPENVVHVGDIMKVRYDKIFKSVKE